MDGKDDKSVAQYGPSSTPNERCGLCRYYTGTECELVAGPISPNAVCAKFALIAVGGAVS